MRRCIVCKGEPAVNLYPEKAAFCAAHFTDHFLRQVERAIKSFKMLTPGQRVFVAVSGGKDSLALWDALLTLGYAAEGFHIDLGIGEHSNASKEACCKYAQNKGARLYLFSLIKNYGQSVMEIARHSRRATCSVCGVIKRYLMNSLARQAGHTVVATGHNLDDEAATLLGNLLSWQEGYLARQNPHLPAERTGFPARIKPLVRLGELEISAYCQLRLIEPLKGGCPLAKGASSLTYKEILSCLEEKMPGTKKRFLFGFLKEGQKKYATARTELGECKICGSPTTAGVCLFCRIMERAGIDPLTKLQLEEFSFGHKA